MFAIGGLYLVYFPDIGGFDVIREQMHKPAPRATVLTVAWVAIVWGVFWSGYWLINHIVVDT